MGLPALRILAELSPKMVRIVDILNPAPYSELIGVLTDGMYWCEQSQISSLPDMSVAAAFHIAVDLLIDTSRLGVCAVLPVVVNIKALEKDIGMTLSPTKAYEFLRHLRS
jgi:hypothetical protein